VSESSNFREFHNVVLCCEEKARQAITLNGATILYLPTVHQLNRPCTRESQQVKNCLSSNVRMREVEMSCCAKIKVSNVSGKRMVAKRNYLILLR
jgi:hypothetical protein